MWCVLGGVLLSRTLAGAVPSALSGLASGFGMGAGRFPVAVTTETTGRAVRYRRLVRLFGYPSGRPCNPHSRTSTLGACVWLVVGLGVDRIVDASLLLSFTAPGCGGVVVCVGLLVPVSSQTVAGLPLLAYQPSSLLGAYQDTEVPCGDLILKMVSRLDAFSGYPSRT